MRLEGHTVILTVEKPVRRPAHHRAPRRKVTYWSVLERRWYRRADGVPDRELAAMTKSERERIARRVGTVTAEEEATP